MEEESRPRIENEDQFWDELEKVLTVDCGDSHELIDDALRNFLGLATTYKEEYLQTEYSVARCSYRVLESALFEAHSDYIRKQFLFGLLQEDDPEILQIAAAFLVFDGKQNEATFEAMNNEGAFARILELVQTERLKGEKWQAQIHDEDDDSSGGMHVGLHRMLLQLLYEMCRVQMIKVQDLMLIEEDFVFHLFDIIESHSDDVHDPYHYPVIRVLLVLNEQLMISSLSPTTSRTAPSSKIAPALPNRIINALSTHGHRYKTFGENIILLLNRESETSLQLLILKLLYLLFTTQATYEYFYTNDLRVLVDVIVRNLLDLPLSARALRHTYLRVLYPMLAHTQLREPENHYKRDELRKLLALLCGTGGGAATSLTHFGATDETTKRLGTRCARVPWLLGDDDRKTPPPPPPHGKSGRSRSTTDIPAKGKIPGVVVTTAPGKPPTAAAKSGSGNGPPVPPPPRRKKSHQALRIGLNVEASESNLSVVEVASHKVKPGVQTPSRQASRRKAAAAAGGKKANGKGVPVGGGGGGGGGGEEESGGGGGEEEAGADNEGFEEEARKIGVLASPFESGE